MVVDTDEFVGPDAEKEPIDIINPDNLDNEAELQDLPLANDFDAMKDVVLTPLLEEPRVLEDAVHTWSVEGWRSMSKKEHGPVFEAGGYPWRILLFPHGNNVDQCSIYLEHGFEPDNIPENWSCCVQFALVLWNPNEPKLYTHHTAHHRFTKEESDWGFTRFIELRKMFNLPWEGGKRPLCENESANITAYLRVVEDETGVLWHNFNVYDSKKETGYVGLRNQGATCYLNSLLQSLYFTNAFRKVRLQAIYEIPTQHDDSMSNSAYALQRLFYQLQTSEVAVGTNELTKSFGWETRHIFEQQDVQEFSRKLMERMEAKMKDTPAERVLSNMFSGKLKSYMNCINVDYESSRVEEFWDVQLNVSGNKNVLESFQDYIQVEEMSGENQYDAGDHGLQDAKKGVVFESMPDVLHLQLKRFEYDIERGIMMKINDRYEFPDEFDATPYLLDSADKSEPWTYKLHGVLVHSGDLNAGHYYAFLKPNKEGWWYKYDDDKVTKATSREVFEENFGGEIKTNRNPMRAPLQKKTPVLRQNSAYMLVYIRQSRLDNILCPVTTDDIPAHLRTRFEEEIALREAKRKEKEEQHLYIGVKVITENTFRKHGGTDLTSFDLDQAETEAAPRSYRTLRSSTLEELVATIAQDIDQDPRKVRLWIMVNRQNKTIRPDQPIMDLKPTVEECFQRAGAVRDSILRVWAEVAEETTPEGEPVWPTYQGQANGVVVKNDLILLFLKHFDAEAQSLNGIGHVYISKEKKVEDLVPIIMKKMGWGDKLSADEKISLWEEIKPTMIEALKHKQSLKAAELQDGDIICFQRTTERKGSLLEKHLGLGEKQAAEQPAKKMDRFDDAKEYYDFLHNKKTVKFIPHPTRCNAEQYPPFEFVLNSKITYDMLSERVGEKLGVPATHIRFWTVNANSGNPKGPVKRGGVNQTLQNILNPSGYNNLASRERTDVFLFEVLEMSLAELDTKKSVKVTWLSEGITKEEPFDLLVAKNGNIDDLIQALVKKAGIPDETEGGRIRIYETSSHKFYRELNHDYPVISLNDYTIIYAERVPEEERSEDEDYTFIPAFHFQNEPGRVHGVPFKFLLLEHEKFSDTKKRLEKRTGFKGKSFEKIKFAVIKRSHFSKPTYLNDDDVLWNVATNDDDLLGLDHVDRTRTVRNGQDLFLK
ncbi:Ubiquitin carboxyl-terminal hydrolase 21 [Colletotrichum plurivorum]|uniref:ubiquitinyl hydrolase 1 n=1 Tax=Colletotrichum plurivorum TaxID=2175906 RepID=A0A8H6NKS7_9PEZI|nr:Ubiquitin carboxyl-terminal hydrolase 21 [Colletotrichum plurivorum]